MAGGRNDFPSLSSYACRGCGNCLPTMQKGPTPITSVPMAPVCTQVINGDMVNKRKSPRGKRNLRCAERWCIARGSITIASASDWSFKSARSRGLLCADIQAGELTHRLNQGPGSGVSGEVNLGLTGEGRQKSRALA